MVAQMFGKGRSVIRGAGRAALVPAAAVAVHQLRYLLTFGGHAGAELAREGHAYLHTLVPWIVALIGVGVGGFLWSLGRAFAGQRSVRRYTVSAAGLWAICAACLLAIYVTQEFLEGLLAVGHPHGLAGIFGNGGWWAVPAAACVGLVLATVLHGARWVVREVVRRRTRPRPTLRRPTERRRPYAIALVPLAPLADGWSGRGPPR
jgi:hypothetical protein